MTLSSDPFHRDLGGCSCSCSIAVVVALRGENTRERDLGSSVACVLKRGDIHWLGGSG